MAPRRAAVRRINTGSVNRIAASMHSRKQYASHGVLPACRRNAARFAVGDPGGGSVLTKNVASGSLLRFWPRPSTTYSSTAFGLQALRQKTKRLEALRIAKHHSLLPLFQTLANGPNMDEDESSAPGYDIKVRIEPVLHDSFHDEHSLNFFARKLRTFWRNQSGDRI